MERTYCRQCNHWHGDYCTAITHPNDDGAVKCGCRNHRQEAA